MLGGEPGPCPHIPYQAARSWTERAYHKLHLLQLGRSRRTAAWEQPQLFSEELRTGFRSLR